MSETLSFAEIKLTPPQSFLRALAISDVLHSAKHFTGSSRRISFHSTETLNSTHFAVGTNDAMLGRCGHAATSGFVSFPKNTLSIVRVDHLADHRHVNRASLRIQSIDAIEFIGPNHATRDEVPFVVPDVSKPLRLFEPGVAFFQLASQRLSFFVRA